MESIAVLFHRGGYYAGINEIFHEYSPFPNQVAYLVNGPKHCFTESLYFHIASTDSPTGDEFYNGSRNTLQKKMLSWVNDLPLPLATGCALEKSVSWACTGDELNLSAAIAGDVSASEYCDEALTANEVVCSS